MSHVLLRETGTPPHGSSVSRARGGVARWTFSKTGTSTCGFDITLYVIHTHTQVAAQSSGSVALFFRSELRSGHLLTLWPLF